MGRKKRGKRFNVAAREGRHDFVGDALSWQQATYAGIEETEGAVNSVFYGLEELPGDDAAVLAYHTDQPPATSHNATAAATAANAPNATSTRSTRAATSHTAADTPRVKQAKKRAKRLRKAAAATGAASLPTAASAQPPASAVRKQKKRKRAVDADYDDGQSRGAVAVAPADDVPDVDMSAWHAFGLHYSVVNSLAKLGYTEPTPIQRSVLKPATLARRDIIGAAETGSGKTLAFGLPILSAIATAQERTAEKGKVFYEGMRALILTPTRELAIQVSDHMRAAATCTKVLIAPVIGGMSRQKQRRIIRGKPHVIVATPGRLWELMNEVSDVGEYLSSLDHLEFFVLDEADRMIERGHFVELHQLLSRLPTFDAEPSDEEAFALRLAKAKKAQEEGEMGIAPQSQSEIMPNAIGQVAKKRRQTFLFSATLGGAIANALSSCHAIRLARARRGLNPDPFSGDKAKKTEELSAAKELPAFLKKKMDAIDDAAEASDDDDDSHEADDDDESMDTKSKNAALREQMITDRSDDEEEDERTKKLIDAIDFQQKKPPLIVDLTSQALTVSTLREQRVECPTEMKDVHLYAFLEANPGRALVFVNSIHCIRRLLPLLQLLKIPAWGLHAQMQQRQRLKNLDRFRDKDVCVLVATDVAARGLDIPSVDHVVHYQCPRTIELYVHRAGRTARARRGGLSMLIVGPTDRQNFLKILKLPGKGNNAFPTVPEDPVRLHSLRKRVETARKLEKAMHQRDKVRRRLGGDTLTMKARKAGLVISDDELSDDDADESAETAQPPKKRQRRQERREAAMDNEDAQEALAAAQRAFKQAEKELKFDFNSLKRDLQQELARPAGRGGRKGFITIDDDALLTLTGSGPNALKTEQELKAEQDNKTNKPLGNMFFTVGGKTVNNRKKRPIGLNKKKVKRRIGKRARHKPK